jgi:hypothetical protein
MSGCDESRVVMRRERLSPFPLHLAAVALGGAVAMACGSTGHQVSGGTTGSTSSGSGTTTGGATTGGTGGLPPGAACSASHQCLSGFCGIFGSGICCAAQCLGATDPACDPTGCAATSGACTYPVGHACGTSSCSGHMLTAGVCDASGACTSATSACANNLLCNATGTGCLTSCRTSADCATGSVCNLGTCGAKVATGACTENDDCLSGICGVNGAGNCCTHACTTTDRICGATECDATGACVYPGKTVVCGSAQTCVGSVQIDASQCSGAGTCSTPTTKDCFPYVCGANACLASCLDKTSCSTGAFCEVAFNTCCPLGNAGSVAVDGATGNDNAGCCGVGTNPPCQTLTRAMALIDSARATNVTIHATIRSGGGDWSPSGEIYPIVLGWGVELNAPGVFFLDPDGGHNEILDVAFYSAHDTVGSASVVGNASSPIGIGMNAANTQQMDDGAALAVEKGAMLYVANATVNDRATAGNFALYRAAILVNGGALVLGQDQSGTTMGTVQIGNALGNVATDGWDGIDCYGAVGAPGIVRDVKVPGNASAVVVEGQNDTDIFADMCAVSLEANPVLGVNSGGSWGSCGQKHDGTGFVALESTATLQAVTIQCIKYQGVQLEAKAALIMDGGTITNCSIGLFTQSGGSVTAMNSLIGHNFVGAWQDLDGTVDLSGGGNTVICNSKLEGDAFLTGFPGMDVYNYSTTVLNASNVTWDTAGPDFFKCDYAIQNCSCNNASCATPAGGDDMDAVEDSTNLGGITTAGNRRSPDLGCH